MWVADSVDRELFEIDPATDTLQRTWQLDLQPSAIATGDGAVWVAGYGNATVEKLDPALREGDRACSCRRRAGGARVRVRLAVGRQQS